MKKIFFFLFLLVKIDGFSQDLKKDIKQSWYSEANTHNLFKADSLILYPRRDSLPKKVDVFEWNHQKRNHFTFIIWETSNSGIVDPAYQPSVSWKLEKCGKHYCLLMRSKRYKTLFNVFPVYENKILKRITLIKLK